VRFLNGTVEMRDCIISGNESVVGGGSNYLGFQSYVDFSLYGCHFTDVNRLGMFIAPLALERIIVSGTAYGVYAADDTTADSPVLLDNTTHARQSTAGKTLNIINPNINLTAAKLRNDTATNVIKEQYTCNIKVVDETGSAVQGATVTCTDTNGSEVFSVTTAADGTITEQTITYKQWEGTNEAAGETTYSPHEFVIYKAGFIPVKIREHTTSGLIDWVTKLKAIGSHLKIYNTVSNSGVQDVLTVENHTGNDTLTNAESGSVHSNYGASGTITLTLPASPDEGTYFTLCVQANQQLRIDPGTATIRDDSGQTADRYKWADAIGETITVVADSSGDWYTAAKVGVWSEEI
jgi:hypothetical protein